LKQERVHIDRIEEIVRQQVEMKTLLI
jgi:hypothetical protein